ncbi:hypothetical protein B0F90DRAFT_1807968 [Multifurca ochricompacta]|uniref:RlpA-like protein double-psi beta-barrel domain-containing protein n=1 Tax=Multifurca ochricompacta TaxID=376703 RepID=A0AAD4MBL4_9AGAM|nr:hypothetical protein B0F90DRAFT_1807968 [Multifurca ochricompacta]
MNRYWFKLALVSLFAPFFLASASYLPNQQEQPTAAELKYSRVHSLGSGYTFDPRDGWQTVNISDLSYKYSPRRVHKVTKTSAPKTWYKNLADPVKTTIKNVFKGLEGIGKAEDVTITWYTGHDLLNPSCWKESVWAPTDNSFACALTLEGWTPKPECFQFLELCHGTERCVFVRVVDTCAGCAKGSKHVDLTKRAFSELADLAQGVLTVKMRRATEPLEWAETLWGPKMKN